MNNNKTTLYTCFQEIIEENFILGKSIGSLDLSNGNYPALFNRIEGERIYFFVDKREVVIELESVPVTITQRGPKSFIYWLSKESSDIKGIKVNFLSVQLPVSNLTEDVEFGVGDDFIRKSRTTSIEKLESRLFDEYVFKHDDVEVIFVERFASKSDQSFVLRGRRKSATIQQVENIFMVTSERNKPLPSKLEEFKNLTPFYYKSVEFTEKSKTKAAHFALQEARKEGRTLIDLWSKYAELEGLRSQIKKDGFGELRFTGTKRLKKAKVRVQFQELSETQKTAIRAVSSNPVGLSFELKRNTERKERGDQKTSEELIFEIEKINTNELILIDPDNSVPENGVLELSIKGNQVQQERREREKKRVINGDTLVLRNLNLIIEDKADSLLEVGNWKLKPETAQTKRYLKEHFGFEKLTNDQNSAVEIALNTDVCIIQGPPGTGKSTVVAAICQRLLEEAQKEGKRQIDNVILLSAFQNDTVDHISSLVSTGGLPTLRIGKESESKESRIQEFIARMKQNINKQLRNHTPNSDAFRTRKKLQEIKAQYTKERNLEACLDELKKLDQSLPIEIRRAVRSTGRVSKSGDDSNNDEIIRQLRGLPLTVVAYSDGGFDKVDELLHYSGIKDRLTDDDVAFLDDAPMAEPSKEFLDRLASFQSRYLDEFSGDDVSQTAGENMGLLNLLDDAIEHFREEERTDAEDEDTFIAANLESILEEVDGDTLEVEKALHHYSDVLAATNQVAGGARVAELGTVENVILEEAARSNPLDLLIPMAQAGKRIIMVGDHKQLPHILERDIAEELTESMPQAQSGESIIDKLEDSLFKVIFSNLKDSSQPRRITLTTQFRTHPFLADFIGRVYYPDEKIISHETANEESKSQNLSIPWAKGKAAVFVDVSGAKGVEKRKGTSWTRPSEAKRVVEILKEFWEDYEFTREGGLSVGVITFYASQRDLIQEECVRHGFMERDENDNYRVAKRYTNGEERLKVGTVDAFQGKEFDVVILSTVRSNSVNREDIENNLTARRAFGHLRLDNRVNVAFSRAKSLIIAVGDIQMFIDQFARRHVKGIHEFATVVSKDSKYGNIIR